MVSIREINDRIKWLEAQERTLRRNINSLFDAHKKNNFVARKVMNLGLGISSKSMRLKDVEEELHMLRSRKKLRRMV